MSFSIAAVVVPPAQPSQPSPGRLSVRLTHGPARLDVQISWCVLRCIGIKKPPARQQAPMPPSTLPWPLALGKSQCGNP